ncbi:hypothetical protein HDU76_006480, partial [Blyttiomyces sp. JEL0837]
VPVAACGGACGYHRNVYIGDIPNQATTQLIYGVLFDLNGCNCGDGSVLDTQTSAASHELFKAVSDPLPGGYRDPVTGSEIGDLCEYRQFRITGASGNSYLVQKMWSNVANTCVE